ncbi:MAG: aminotransferase class V-fold PLP-dependent enzyme [Rhizobiales bacterium]|nr:aminotransferase class V-fold PLP-dependent enzyme [Hyphomicrobiales bacterium]
MTVANGRRFLSIPGPTNVPDEVLAAMHRPAIDIYKGDLVDTTAYCLDSLKRVFRTKGNTYIYAANGHGAWEAALSNVLSRGDKVLVLESGLFATGWGEMADVMGIEVEILPGDIRSAVDPAAVEQRLRQDSAGEIKAVLVVQVDTASSVVNDIPKIRAAIDAAGHGALFMVDAIASLGTMQFEMDMWEIDVAVTGSQKGLMMTPGLSYVAANPRALERHKSAGLVTRYWDWTFRNGELHYQKYCGTPPEHMLFGQAKAFEILLAEGLEAAWQRHAILAAMVQAAVAKWAEAGALEFNITKAAERAGSVTTVVLKDHDPAPLLDLCDEKCGVTLGITIGPLDGNGFRIAHMGHVNAPMVLGTLGVLEAALGVLDIPHAPGGVLAATETLAAALKD